MELNLRTYSTLAELTIQSGSVKLTEDMATFDRDVKDWRIPESDIEQFLTVANDMSRFNHVSDVDFCKKICDAFLDDTDIKELVEIITEEQPSDAV